MRTGMLTLMFVCGLMVSEGLAQQEPAKPADGTQSQSAQPSKAPLMSPIARLRAAKTVFLTQYRGSGIALNVISSGLEGWGKYQVLESSKDADLIVKITAPTDSSGVSVSSSTSTDGYGKPQSNSSTSKDLSSSSMITVTVMDAANKVTLWRGSEQAKSAMKQKQREDNMVEAAQKLLARFRDEVEPVK